MESERCGLRYNEPVRDIYIFVLKRMLGAVCKVFGVSVCRRRRQVALCFTMPPHLSSAKCRTYECVRRLAMPGPVYLVRT